MITLSIIILSFSILHCLCIFIKKNLRAFVDLRIWKIKVWLLTGGEVNDSESAFLVASEEGLSKEKWLEIFPALITQLQNYNLMSHETSKRAQHWYLCQLVLEYSFLTWNFAFLDPVPQFLWLLPYCSRYMWQFFTTFYLIDFLKCINGTD